MNETINAGNMLNDLAMFDQAVVGSAMNLKASFDVEITGISQTFATSFQAIDAITQVSASNFSMAFELSAALMTELFGRSLSQL